MQAKSISICIAECMLKSVNLKDNWKSYPNTTDNQYFTFKLIEWSNFKIIFLNDSRYINLA